MVSGCDAPHTEHVSWRPVHKDNLIREAAAVETVELPYLSHSSRSCLGLLLPTSSPHIRIILAASLPMIIWRNCPECYCVNIHSSVLN